MNNEANEANIELTWVQREDRQERDPCLEFDAFDEAEGIGITYGAAFQGCATPRCPFYAARVYCDWVQFRKESFAIANLVVPYALLVPATETGCNSHGLAADLAGASLPVEDRRNLATAIRKGRRALKSSSNCAEGSWRLSAEGVGAMIRV